MAISFPRLLSPGHMKGHSLFLARGAELLLQNLCCLLPDCARISYAEEQAGAQLVWAQPLRYYFRRFALPPEQMCRKSILCFFSLVLYGMHGFFSFSVISVFYPILGFSVMEAVKERRRVFLVNVISKNLVELWNRSMEIVKRWKDVLALYLSSSRCVRQGNI